MFRSTAHRKEVRAGSYSLMKKRLRRTDVTITHAEQRVGNYSLMKKRLRHNDVQRRHEVLVAPEAIR